MVNNNVDYNTKVLEVKDLKKHFYHGVGKNKLTIPAVDGLTFDVYKREVFGLVGESGCGKTTTGRTIIKLYNATEGVVKLNGEIIGAGYKEHVRDIKRIKEEAGQKILAFDEYKFKTTQIKKELDFELGLLKQDLDMINRTKDARIREAQKPFDLYKEQRYQVKNDYQLDMERIKYKYDLELGKIKDLTTNNAKKEYERELAGLKIGYERKEDGLKDSAALTKETIEKRIQELKATYDQLHIDLEAKYVPLIQAGEAAIIAKEDAKARIAKLKEVRKADTAARKEAYAKEKAAIVKPVKEKVNLEVAKTKDAISNEIADIKKKMADLKAKAEKEMAAIPKTDSSVINSPEVQEQIAAVKEERDLAVKEKKAIIHELNTINKSKEALEYSRKMQMIFQDPISSLNPRMTVLEIVGEGLTIQGGYSAEEIKEKVQETLEIVGLSREYAARYPHEFSGGQRQRIGVARALIMNPDFIIADEPISALDVSIRAQVINLLHDLKEKLGLTIMFIAHDLSVVRFFCDRIAVMYNGKIVELAEAEELFANPTHPYTKSLLSSVPQPDPDYEKNRTRINYNPRQHDYRKDRPELREIGPQHFIYVNEKEFKELKAEYDKMNSVKGDVK